MGAIAAVILTAGSLHPTVVLFVHARWLTVNSIPRRLPTAGIRID